jgi:hypothetical protein
MEDVAKEIVKEEPKTVTPPESTNADDAAFGGFAMCPRCGFDTRGKVVPVDEEDKKQYIRCMLGDKAFAKDYILFDGAFTIRFVELNTDEEDKLITLIRSLLQDPMFMIKATKVKILFSTIGFKKDTGWTNIDREAMMKLETVEAALEMYAKYFGKFPGNMNGSITNLYNAFSNQVIMIANGSFSRDF